MLDSLLSSSSPISNQLLSLINVPYFKMSSLTPSLYSHFSCCFTTYPGFHLISMVTHADMERTATKEVYIHRSPETEGGMPCRLGPDGEAPDWSGSRSEGRA